MSLSFWSVTNLQISDLFVVQVVATVLACWLASGIVFGFAALKPILVAEGVYHESCTDEELRRGVELCTQQDLKCVLPSDL